MQKKRVIFVGIHCKPGMAPLDSKTKSGKKIDRLIDLLRDHIPAAEFKKSNLINLDYLPEPYDPESEAHLWAIREEFRAETDVVVALGRTVQNAFKMARFKSVVEIPHPAARVAELKYKYETLDKVQALWQ